MSANSENESSCSNQVSQRCNFSTSLYQTSTIHSTPEEGAFNSYNFSASTASPERPSSNSTALHTTLKFGVGLGASALVLFLILVLIILSVVCIKRKRKRVKRDDQCNRNDNLEKITSAQKGEGYSGEITTIVHYENIDVLQISNKEENVPNYALLDDCTMDENNDTWVPDSTPPDMGSAKYGDSTHHYHTIIPETEDTLMEETY